MKRQSPTPQPHGTPDSGDCSAAACTRTRLLETAGEVFAERGYRDATVREICTRAGANIAAVNYYFKGKEGLYAEVVKHAQCCMHRDYPLSVDPGAGAQERLAAFIRAFLWRVLDDARPAWHTKLMSREMVEPTAALDQVVADTIRPTFGVLGSILAELMPGATPDQLRLAGASIVGQCLMHRHCRPVLERLFPGHKYGERELEALADHVVAFSVAGVRALASNIKAGNDGTPHAAPVSKRRSA